MSDARWVVFHELRAEGFPRLLWEAMTCLGYSDRPEYSFHEYEEFGVEFCAVRVQLFDCAKHQSGHRSPASRLEPVVTTRDRLRRCSLCRSCASGTLGQWVVLRCGTSRWPISGTRS